MPISADASLIAALRCRIARVERRHPASPPLALGLADIDRTLAAAGLGRAGLHEIFAGDDGGAALAFAARLLGLATAGEGTAVWCRPSAELYAPGLAALGFDPARLLLVVVRTADGVAWAMEEALRCRAVAAVLGETAARGTVALRRLQLAAEAAGAMAILLRPAGVSTTASPARSRWRIAAAPGGDGRFPASRWRVTLEPLRHGRGGNWLLDVNDATGDLRLAADVCDRSPVRPAAAG